MTTSAEKAAPVATAKPKNAGNRARQARALAAAPSTMCRGIHSKCRGRNPSKSVSWHLCVPCSILLKASQKAAKLAAAPKTAKVATPKSAGSSKAVVKAKRPAKAVATPVRPHGTAPRPEQIARKANVAPMMQSVAFSAPETDVIDVTDAPAE
jgi:hypothetical protein